MRIRPTARVLVLDDQQRLLLFHVHDDRAIHQDYPDMTIYWCTPGGGGEPDETVEQAAQRELWEETGIQVSAVGPCVWCYERILDLPSGRLCLQERFFIVTVPVSQVSTINMLAYEHTNLRAYRWWSLQELVQSGERFLPPNLPHLLPPLLNGDLPATPILLPIR